MKYITWLTCCSATGVQVRGEHARERGGGQGAAAQAGSRAVRGVEERGQGHHAPARHDVNSRHAIHEPRRLRDGTGVAQKGVNYICTVFKFPICKYALYLLILFAAEKKDPFLEVRCITAEKFFCLKEGVLFKKNL